MYAKIKSVNQFLQHKTIPKENNAHIIVDDTRDNSVKQNSAMNTKKPH